MDHRQRRVLQYAGAFVGVVLLYTFAYKLTLGIFEGETRSFARSLLVVVETFTTLGYGSDASAWTAPQTIALMIVMQFTAVFLIFMAIPLFVSPWIEETFSTQLPDAIDRENHVIVCAFSGRNRMLLDELEVVGIEAVVVEADRDTALSLHEDGIAVINGDPESRETLEAAGLDAARSLVADVDDEANASIAMAAKHDARTGGPQVLTFAEDPDVAEYHRYAGADQVFTPRTMIGHSLANKVTTSIEAGVGDAVEIGEDLEIVELPVQPSSELAGETIAESGIRERTGANVVGAWFRGEFVSPPSPDARIDQRTVLLVAGKEPQLERLKTLTLSDERQVRSGPVIVGGLGEVGSTVAAAVRSADYTCRTVDNREGQTPDIVGDITDAEDLVAAGITDASVIVLALSDDTDAIFATLAIRQLDPDVEVIARANETANVVKLYQAGADYVLSLSTVSGRMLASTILGEEMLTYDQQIALVRASVGPFAGQTLAGADIRSRIGVTVVAIERDGALITELSPDFELQDGDEAIVAGPDEAVTSFTALTGPPRSQGHPATEASDD
jgi:Trk K+ transport system NAD-binding subunit